MNNKMSVRDGVVGDAMNKTLGGVMNDAKMTEDRVILVDKPAGMSSFGVVAKVRGMLKAQLGHKIKVGHTGTLDPFATGLLILLTGKMTKKSSEFLKLDKEYVATMKLGYTSSTGDPEGEIQLYSTRGASGRPVDWSCRSVDVSKERTSSSSARLPGSSTTGDQRHSSSCQVPNPLRLNVIESTLDSFVGKITQTPPRYSAIKVGGERAYKLARKGVEFEIPSREVEIYGIEILRYEWPELTIRCYVSSGTYIRTLAEDIGARLGVGAYLTALRRTRVGEYDVKDAVSLDELCAK